MRRLVLVSCALLSIAGLAVGSGGFSSTAADRGVSVAVVGDEDAYMALNYADRSVEREATVGDEITLPVVDVTNQFTEAVDVTVDYRVDDATGLDTDDGSETAALGAGQATAVSTDVACTVAGDYEITATFDATADGNGVAANTSRPRTVRYEITCLADRSATATPSPG